jgi:hypothetical protein
MECPWCDYLLRQDEQHSDPVPERSKRSGGFWRLTNPLLWIAAGGLLILLCSGAALTPLILEAAVPENEELSRQIVGTWLETGTDGQTTTVETETFLPNGISKMSGTETVAGQSANFTMTCKWQIRGNTIHYTITESSSPDSWIGYKYTYEIVKLTDSEMILRRGNAVFTAHRIGDQAQGK